MEDKIMAWVILAWIYMGLMVVIARLSIHNLI